MVRTQTDTAGSPDALVTIRHSGEWDQGRHGAPFLRPLIDGVRRRLLMAAAKIPPPASPSSEHSP